MIEAGKFENFEFRVLETARTLDYPPTPNLAGAFQRGAHAVRRPPPRWAYALAIVLVVLIALLSVPEVRARILEFFRIGAIQIELPTAEPIRGTPTSENLEQYGDLIPISNLSGETTLANARKMVDFPVPLPTYPSNLGDPDHIYIQSIESGADFIVLAWIDAENAEKVEIALYVIGPGISITKGPVDEIQATLVDGHPAAYIRGMHYLQVDRMPDYGVLVQAPALIWEADGITYRIEADIPLRELIRIAESLNVD